ncbi:uncharacterized protein LOC116247304 isoform X2 [Nymphaea colorata]|nr:uncharacterized protein LOC116247304 isoform X2 [Nymphaea colorata]
MNHMGWNFSNSLVNMPIKKRRVPLMMTAAPSAAGVSDQAHVQERKQESQFRSTSGIVEHKRVSEPGVSNEGNSVMEITGPSVEKGASEVVNDIETSGTGCVLVDTKCAPNQADVVGERSLSENNSNMVQETVDHESRSKLDLVSEKASIAGSSAVSAGIFRSMDLSSDLNNREESTKAKDDFHCIPGQRSQHVLAEDAEMEGSEDLSCIQSRESRFHWDLNTSMETWDEPSTVTGCNPRSDISNQVGNSGTFETEQSNNKNYEVEEIFEKTEVHSMSLNQMVKGSEYSSGYGDDVKRSEAPFASDDLASSQGLGCHSDEDKAVADDMHKIATDAVVHVTQADNLLDLNKEKVSANENINADYSSCPATMGNPSSACTMSSDQVGDFLGSGNCSQKSGITQTCQSEGFKYSTSIKKKEAAFLCAEAHSHNSSSEPSQNIESSGGKNMVLQSKLLVTADCKIGVSSTSVPTSCANGVPIMISSDEAPKTLSYPLAHPAMSVDSAPMSYEDEKINISEGILDEDPYDSEYESDGCHAAGSGTQHLSERQDEDDSPYEEGELRETIRVPEDEEHEKNIDKKFCSSASVDENGPFCTTEEKGDCRIVVSAGKEDNHHGSDVGNVVHEKGNDPAILPESHVQASIVNKESVTSFAILGSTEAGKVMSEDHALKDCCLGEQVVETKSDQAHSASLETVTEDGQVGTSVQLKTVRHCSSAEATKSDCSTMKSPVRDEVLKEPRRSEEVSTHPAGKTSKSRIISLGRPSDGSSRDKRGSISNATPTRIKMEKCIDSLSSKDKVLVQGNRDEMNRDSSSKFKKDRNKERTFAGTVSDSPRLRGRVVHPDDTSGSWDSDQQYTAERQNGITGFRTMGSKNAAIAAAAKLESDGFIVAPDGTIVTERTGARVRSEAKAVNISSQSFHMRQQRRLTAAREGEMPFDMQMARRSDRCRNPDAEFHEFGSELVVPRRGARFLEGVPKDTHGQAFSRLHYASADDRPLRRGERSFSPVGRMGSYNPGRRSPRRLRTRSPQLWLSPRRRSSERSDGCHSPVRCRSPPPFKFGHGFERRRSPCQGSSFPHDMMDMCASTRMYRSSIPRRHEEIRDMAPMDRNRVFIPDRVPSGRLSPRNMRRFARVDSPERMDIEKNCRRLLPGRFREFANDARETGYRRFSDEGVNFVEKRGPVRAVRHFDVEDVERVGVLEDDYDSSYDAIRSEVNVDFHRSSSRDFGRGIKSRLGTSPRKEKFREDRDDGPEYSRRCWRHDAAGVCHDDVIMSKRRRFDG